MAATTTPSTQTTTTPSARKAEGHARRRSTTETAQKTSAQATEAAAINPVEIGSWALALPALDAPSVSPRQPAASYKIAFGNTTTFFCSRDGGKTSSAIDQAAVAGAVIDLALEIRPANTREGDDYRLRVAFMDCNGELAELNLNAVSAAADGIAYVTSPARSLTGALLSISDTDEDMRAFCEGSRFTLRKGNGRGVFIETDLALNGRWVRLSGAMETLRAAKAPEHLGAQITAIKNRFRSCGLLLAGPAVLGGVSQNEEISKQQ